MSQSAKTECFVKGSSNKPVCKVPECKGLQAESLHNLLTGDVSSVHTVQCKKEENEEKGFVNMAEGKYKWERNEGWRTHNNSWLDLEEKDLITYHVNEVIDRHRANN